MEHNAEHGITPVGIEKSVQDIMEGARRMPTKRSAKGKKSKQEKLSYGAEVLNLTPVALARKLKQMETQMHEHAKNLEFEEAANLRDEVAQIKQLAFLS
jgi:excinuclease ABC subunit B